jgi:speckle-type POZ protein
VAAGLAPEAADFETKILKVPHALILDSTARGEFTVTAMLRQSGDVRVVGSPVRAPPLAPSDQSLLSQLAKLHRSGRGADVMLLCSDGETLAAHALLLSLRSPVFEAQLSGPLAGESQTLTVPDDIHSPVMRRVLDYVYTDELTVTSHEEGQHLLNAADHYGMTGLLAIAERALIDSLPFKDAALTLTLAEQHGAAALKRETLNFVAAHSIAVMDTPGWAHLRASCPALLEEVIRTMGAGPQQA